jgi:hypothetical protein
VVRPKLRRRYVACATCMEHTVRNYGERLARAGNSRSTAHELSCAWKCVACLVLCAVCLVPCTSVACLVPCAVYRAGPVTVPDAQAPAGFAIDTAASAPFIQSLHNDVFRETTEELLRVGACLCVWVCVCVCVCVCACVCGLAFS